MRRFFVVLLAASAAAAPIQPLAAQGIGARLRQGARNVSDALRNAVRCVASDTQCIQNAQAQGHTVTVTDSSGQRVSSADSAAAIQRAATARDSQATPAPTPAQTPAADAAPASTPPGQGTWLNYDFIPGDRVLWWEDFSGDDVGDFPRRMQLISGNFEVVNVDGHRYLRTVEGGYVAIILPAALPTFFTMEVDYYSPQNGNSLSIHTTNAEAARWGCFHNSGWVDGGAGMATSSQSAQGIPEHDFVHCRFTISDRYIKAYLNEHRVANVPTTQVARTDSIVFQLPGSGNANVPTLITNIRIASGGRRLYDALSANGRVATQGILFDTGSDQIRGESTPTLNEIGQMLTEHADLRLTIEGHTDNVGVAASNQSLSERRAASVRQYMIDHVHIDAARLASAGFGAAHPAAPNTTAEGRQTNRRVELVRMP